MIRNFTTNRLYASCCCTTRGYAAYARPPSNSNHDRPYRRRADSIEKAENKPRLPRYLRRESSFPAATGQRPSTDRELDPSSSRNAPRVYRSRHIDPTQVKDDKSDIRLLEPHVLSARLRKLCDANQIDAAVSMLKNAPLDAQNTPVWNTCIWECMKAKRFKLGYQLFIDMKRRGFSPTTRTFQTIFSGLSRIEHWTTHPKQLENARSVYDSFQRHMAAVKKDDPKSAELSVQPLASYIKILGDAGCYQEIFDVYYAMDSEGPLAPDQYIFTAMFQALATKPEAAGGQTPAAVNFKNAADAKLLWTQMLKAAQKSPGFEVDAIVVTSALKALSRGRLTDQTFAFTIVRDYYGLTAPGDSPTKGSIPLAPQSLAAILMLCNSSQKHSLCAHFFQQVKRRPEALGGVSILDRAHLEEVLKGRLALSEAGSAYYCLEILEWMLRQEITGRNGPRIRPALTTYNLVLTACWRDGDWKSATRVFDLMTGYHAHDFMDGSISSAPRLDNRGPGRTLAPNPETLSSMVRTALTSRDRANVRQSLRIVDYLGAHSFFKPTEKADDPKSVKNIRFYTLKLASAVADAVRYVPDAGERGPSSDEVGRWKSLASQAAVVQRSTSKFNSIPTTTEAPQRDRVQLTQHEKALRR